MVKQIIHPLRKWRMARGYTLEAAAIGIGTFRQTWHDWEIQRRIPDREYMRRLFAFTGGAIAPNDFYDLPDLGERELALDAGPAPLLDSIADRETGKAQGAAWRLQAAT